tara:strand:- start:2497 stop:3708 length:1212 start_codon:yes stop_codon:yes gene_type:complete
MTVRQSITDISLNPANKQDRIKSGLEGQNIPDDFYLPPCGLEDIDRALFDLFDKEIQFAISQNNETRKVPVIFATGERFALMKRNEPLRDENEAFILPLISIRRSGIDQAAGFERLADTGDLVIKRRLSSRDPVYQNLVNPENIRNQENARSEANNANATDPISAKPGAVNSRRLPVKTASGGPVLSNTFDSHHIYEIITIPFPHFINVTYEVTFWTSYTMHMNSMIEKFVGSYTGNRNQFKIASDKGYWFVAYPDSSVTNQDNFDDFTNDERIVRYTFTMQVPAYIVASENSGDMRPFRKFVSAPDLAFEIFTANAPIVQHPSGLPDPTGDIDKFILSDVNNINSAGDIVENERMSYLKAQARVRNPFTDEDEIQFLKVLTQNQRQGETVVSARIVTKIEDL